MFLRPLLLAGCLFVSQLSFAAPVPADKSAYVGQWRGDGMRLTIQQNGRVEYKRDQPNSSSYRSFELQRFDGKNFSGGSDPDLIVVSKPPYRDQGKWKMVVDGVELTRGE